jgi:CubicO group peptidase (beta-lactamase class C family)
MFLVAVSLAACGGGSGDAGGNGLNGREPEVNPGLPPVISVTPEATGDGWTVSTPEAEGMNSDALLKTLQTLREGLYPGVDSLVVVRRERLVAEGYFNGFGRESLHDLRSTGKSVTSALAGIAIGQGLLGVDDLISRHLAQFDIHENMDARKRAIKVFHLLNMNSGLECDDGNPASPGNEERMYRREDWVGFVLDLPMVAEPGVTGHYCTGGVVVLGHIIATRSAMGLDAFAATWLFGPLDIRQSGWRRAPDGSATGGGGLRLRPRDAAKFGALYLNGGTWNGVRVIPADWVQKSRQRVQTLRADGYGFLWWKRSFLHRGQWVECFFTAGNGGNYIFVLPSLELVAVFTGSNYNSPLSDQPYQVLETRILPAVE